MMGDDRMLETAWVDAEKSISPRARSRIGGLKRFLGELDNAHARQLSGRPLDCDARPDTASARALEAHIIARIRTGDITSAEAADWLRVVHLLIGHLRAAGLNLAETRLPATLPSTPSPFSEPKMQAAARTRLWREALYAGLESVCADAADPALLWGAALLSAILHGALLDSTKLTRLVEHLGAGGRFDGTTPRCYLEFDLPHQGLGDLHLQRWFPDALSAMLLIRVMRTLNEGATSDVPQVLPKPRTAILRYLNAQGVPRDKQPTSIRDLIDAATTMWRAHAASLEVDVMTRGLAAHAIHRRSWQRIAAHPAARESTRRRSSTPDVPAHEDSAYQELLENVPLMHPWLEPALAALHATAERSDAQVAIHALRAEHEDNALAAHYLEFITFLLEGHSATGKPLALSTIRLRVTETLRRLLFHLGGDDPTQKSLEDLQALYSEISNECEADSARLALKTGLREFHAYLVRRHGLPHIQRLDLVLGDDAHLMPVDANLVTIDEYWAAQACLDEDLARGAAPDQVRIAKLVLMLGFRLGLRAMEIFGLRLEDVHVQARSITVLVRDYPGHRLKTQNSKRLLPAHALLAPSERLMLRGWVSRRAEEERLAEADPQLTSVALLLARTKTDRTAVSYEGISDRVYAALRRATGDRLLFMHHLRHAFATWTMLRLRAPDYPEISAFFAEHPATCHWLANGRRARLQLLGHLNAPSRVYAYAVARLLGHSSPTVSMGHYIHGSEIVMAAIAERELGSLPSTLLVTASGLPATTAIRHLERSSAELVARVLERLPALSPSQASEPEADVELARRRGRPKAVPPHRSEQWLALEKVRAILYLAALPDLSAPQIAEQLRLAPTLVAYVLSSAPAYAASLGLGLTPTNVPQFPRPRLPAELAFLARFEAHLAALERKTPSLCRAGLRLHLAHFNRQKHDVVFTGARHTDALATYLQFLGELGIETAECQCVLRTQDNKARAPAWVEPKLRAQLPVRIRRIGPPSIKKVTSYAKWLGIRLTEPNGNGLGHLAGVTCMLALLALEAKDQALVASSTNEQNDSSRYVMEQPYPDSKSP